MAYLTYEEYNSYNTGVEVSESEFAALSFYAETAINTYIGREVRPDGIIKQAEALQIALSKTNGGTEYYSDISSGGMSSVKLGDFSYSVSAADSRYREKQEESGLFPVVQTMLKRYRTAITPVKVRL